ncbi:MAG: hypothetical protein QXI16_03730 [Sulfolobaceae archaeon]
MAELITTITSFVTAFITWIGDLLDMVTSQPLLLVFVVLAIVGVVIAMVKKWIPGKA